MEFIFIMLGLHCIADYSLQSAFMADFKGTNVTVMVGHCAIWTLCIFSGLWFFSVNSSWQLPYLFAGHMGIEYWKQAKCGKGEKLTSELLLCQFVQFIHISLCAIIR